MRINHAKLLAVLKFRQNLARAYLRGLSQFEIMASLRCDARTLRRELDVIHTEWLQSSLVDFDAAKAREVAKIDHLEETYWSAWERSRQGGQDEAGEPQDKSGNPRFLEGVQQCIDKRCSIFGLYKPAPKADGADQASNYFLTLIKVVQEHGLTSMIGAEDFLLPQPQNGHSSNGHGDERG